MTIPAPREPFDPITQHYLDALANAPEPDLETKVFYTLYRQWNDAPRARRHAALAVQRRAVEDGFWDGSRSIAPRSPEGVRKDRIARPAAEQLVAAYKAAGSVVKAAESLGVSGGTFRRWLHGASIPTSRGATA